MKTIFKTPIELVDNPDARCPISLEMIWSQMGIKLLSVEVISWTEQDDGQLVSLTIHFDPIKKRNYRLNGI